MSDKILILPKSAIDLNKVQLHEMGQESANELMAGGYHDAHELLIHARKCTEVLGAFVGELESETITNLERNGGELVAHNSKLTLGSSGDRINYKNDPEWVAMNDAIKAREELLKVAWRMKEPIFDSEGVEVPRVGLSSVSKTVIRVKL